jgi:hypothetical protein
MGRVKYALHHHSHTATHDLYLEMSEKKDPVLESIAQTKAVYKRLGKSGLRVSVPIFGAMSIGHEDWQPWVLNEEKVGWNGTQQTAKYSNRRH